MSDTSRGPTSPSLALMKQVDSVCQDFENAWRSQQPIPIHALLEGWPEDHRPALLAELIPLEVELRLAAGESPDRREYLERFPGQDEAVAAAFDGAETRRAIDPEKTLEWESRDSRHSDVIEGFLSPGEGPPYHFGDYEILDELARGGMGIVFRARHRGLNRVVALKMILAGRFATEAEQKRFRMEAELAANLDHPNLVPIYEVGEHSGRLYFSMKLVDGGTLAGRIDRLLEDPKAVARLLAKVARAIHHAHGKGFVHCDLKPSNILLDADGQPYVTDFGLARRVGDDGSLTATGAMLGTPSYMAPEQASGARRDLTAAADVYGLGAILYEAITGRPPFRAETLMETVVQVLEREPVPPRVIRPKAPIALERICLRCLEKVPGERYASAAAMAEALEQYLRGEVIGGASLWESLRRWTRREPELVARIGGLVAIIGVTQYNFHFSSDPGLVLHLTIQGIFILWALASVLFQTMLRRGSCHSAARFAWAATDVSALTCAMVLMEARPTSLVVGYPLLIAASGLWCRTSLVWFTTGLALAGYLLLCVMPTEEGAMSLPTSTYPNIDIAAMLVTGFVVARQVKRIWALGVYYENRPGP